MTATYTFDVFCSLDGFGSYAEPGDWGGYWSKHGPEFLDARLTQYRADQRLVLGATTYRQFVAMLGTDSAVHEQGDQVVARMMTMPLTVVSGTLEDPLEWSHATLLRGDAVEVVRRLKEESPVPLRSHGSLSLNRALLAAGLVDEVQVTVFPVVTGQTGTDRVLGGAPDLDLELLSSRTYDGRIQELVYRPTLHRHAGT